MDPVTGGGTAERTFQMSRYLVKSGNKCSILTTDCGMTERRRAELKDVKLIAMRCLIKRIFLPLVPVNKIRNAIDEVDIIHLMGHWTIVNAIAYVYARIMSKPYVVCPAGTLNIYGRSTFMKRAFNAVIGKRIIRNAAGYIAVSKDEKDHFATVGIDKNAVSVIPNGVNMEDYLDEDVSGFRLKYNIGSGPYILYMGRLNYHKGPDLLLQAFHRTGDKLKDYKLVFAGPDEDMLEWMKGYVSDNGLRSRVLFLGHISGARKSQAYYGSEVVVIPSRRDAMSIVVLEAGATATPVILTDRCGFDEVSDVNGGMVVGASVEEIANGLMEYAGNREVFKKMGENLRKMTVDQYSWDCIIERIISLYRDILDRAPCV